MAWPPQFEEDLHPRGRGGKFAPKPGAPAGGQPPRKGAPQKAGAPGVPRPGAPAAPAAKKAPAAKRAAPSARPQRRAMRYDPASAARLQASGQPDVAVPVPTKDRPSTSPYLGTGNVRASDANLDAAASRAAGANAEVPGDKIPTGGLGPKAQQLAVGRDADGSMNWAQRGAYVDQRLTHLRENKIDSQTVYRDKDTGEWSPERRAQQEAIIEEIWNRDAAHVPNEGRGIFSGGLGGAGKGYALGKVEKVSDRDFFTVNPDDVKELMAKRGMIPMELDQNMTPMELSPTVHEEASDIAKELAKRAYAEKKNVVWDLTMSSESSIMGRVNKMREMGYTNIGALFVDTTVERSVQQARQRWRNGMDRFINGDGDGGRYLPSKATEENIPTPGSGYNSKNREVFEAIKGNFDGHVMYQNLDGKMVHLETAGKGIPK